MNTENMIEITGIDLKKLVQEVYDLSRPVGMGFFHFTPEPLTDAEINDVLAHSIVSGGKCVLHLDYVKGRACKFGVWKYENRLYIHDHWYDHTDSELEILLERIGIKNV